MKRAPGKVVRLIVIVLGVIAALAVGGVVYTSCQLESIVERRLEERGTEALGTKLEVGAVKLSLLTGEGSLQRVTLHNAQGFREPSLFDVDEIEVGLDAWSVLSSGGPVRVREVAIRDATITLEAQLFKTNVSVLRDRLEGREPRGASKRKLTIERFTLKRSRLRLVFHGPLRKTVREIAVPDIELRDIGGREGLPPREVAKIIVTAVGDKVRASATRTKGPWQEVLKNLRARVQDRLEGVDRERLRKVGKGLLERWRQRQEQTKGQ